jgi:FeS assembly SUF system protein
MNKQVSNLEPEVIEALKRVFDPEIPLNIYDLGLIYEIRIDEEGNVSVKMTLTAPNCPVAEDMPNIVQSEVAKVPGVKSVNVEIVFDPPWDKDMLSEAALLELGLI